MLRWSEFAIGMLIWLGVIWDGFATIVLPRSVAPMKRLAGRFNRWSWRLWSAVGRGIRQRDRQLIFLSVYGPVSVMLLLVIWAGLMIVAFAMIYHGLGPRFQADRGSIDFGALLYMSGSTFLTLGLGDITSTDPTARAFMILETATGYIFLGLIITYMPALEQSYGEREADNLLIHSRAGHPPSAVKLLHRYARPDRLEILRGILRECERWMAGLLQTHLSHPVLSFYRAHHWGQAWLVSLTIVLDSCALMVVSGDGIAAEQARLTYRMGLHLLRDLTDALGLTIDPQFRGRLTEDEVPALLAALKASAVPWTPGPRETAQLLRLVRRYEVYLMPLSEWLVIPLPDWVPAADEGSDADDTGEADRADESP
jgi:hypothetical protein